MPPRVSGQSNSQAPICRSLFDTCSQNMERVGRIGTDERHLLCRNDLVFERESSGALSLRPSAVLIDIVGRRYPRQCV